MAPERHLHERIYLSLKSILLSHDYRSGQRIDIAGLAERFQASVTPVRDGLCRLVGEEVVEMLPSGGFRLWLPTVDSLRDIYFWNGQHLLAALHATSFSAIQTVLVGVWRYAGEPLATPEIAVPRLFQRLADASANREFSRQVAATNARLYHVRRREPALINDFHAEAKRLAIPDHTGVQKAVRRRILAYHRRRILLAPQIAERLALEAEL
ncbi:GntR family transcriptional regulator [Sphingosinicella xenopeptidilytica]|uniref:GntR family transcriptional regulator n=1 Tax=Sphingosinicella xenopeptidilytica TaxID=364098 RepID=A0ABW3C5F8_SPHXN